MQKLYIHDSIEQMHTNVLKMLVSAQEKKKVAVNDLFITI